MVDSRIQQLSDLGFRNLNALCELESNKFSPSELTQEHALSNVHKQLLLVQEERNFLAMLAREEIRLHSKFVLNQSKVLKFIAAIEESLKNQMRLLASSQNVGANEISAIL